MNRWRLCLLALGILCCSTLTFSQADDKKEKHGFVDHVFKGAGSDESKYFVFVPHDYKKGAKPYPLIVFLHGRGGSSSDVKKLANGGLAAAIHKNEKTFGFIVVFPQAPKPGNIWLTNSPENQRAMQILAEVQKTYTVDPKRIYLTGLSSGGFGTWHLAVEHPEKWAAIVPICGGGDPSQAKRIKNIPCWCFHGAADKTVKVDLSRQMISALKAAGGTPKYTEYPGVDHNCWDKAYATTELYEWLLKQHLK
jgi:predicted peptidase